MKAKWPNYIEDKGKIKMENWQCFLLATIQV